MLKNRDRRISIQRFNETTNAFNEVVKTWGTLATVWASKEDIKDGERFAAGQVSASITTRFQIRYSQTVSSVSPLDRVEFENRVYEIVGVKEIGRREGLEITAAARADLAPTGGVPPLEPIAVWESVQW
ncbi:phage head closure protein [Aureimonas altamirensis]|uniref:phage head closure protein n=1 Tax=Aureimonas altamirensis TaxID=370622 RepID=UPI0020369F52|nr:phage head closure protein [Aureimonas altamirensis]MCM2506068.1 phage head closure protein [Aureimonas altamirensis]